MQTITETETKSSSRQDMILDQVKRDGRIRVADFSRQTGVSAVTIRKDLEKMEQEGLLCRVHGGAVCAQIARSEHNYIDRRNQRKAEKKLIARAVAGLINDGDSVLVNVGTTSEYVIDELKVKHNLIVITNALPILNRLNYCDSITTFFLGGCFEANMQITIGDNVIDQLSRYTADKLIMGMDGVDPRYGLTSKNHVEDYIMHKMIEQSKEKILVVDDSKLGRSSFVRITDITAFDTLVTNYCPEKEEILDQIRKKGLRVVIAR